MEKNLFQEIKLTPDEEKVLSIIAEKGEYLWQPMHKDYVSKAVLKELMWMDYIERKPQYGNVFLAKFWGKKIMEWNKNARDFKKLMQEGGEDGK